MTRALRVLVVAGREPWPLNGGGRLRLHHFVKWLARDAAVTLALPYPAQHAEQLPPTVHTVNMAAMSANHAARRRVQTPAVARRMQQHFGAEPAVEHWLHTHARHSQFDVALLYGAVTGQYIDAVRVPAVWDAVDELVLYTVRDTAGRKLQRWPTAIRAAAQYAVFERHVARHARATVFTSTVDASYARRFVGRARVETITNGVDFSYFRGPTQAPQPGTVVFVGSLTFPPNVDGITWFTTRVWPHLRPSSQHRLLIVGREPVADVRALVHRPGVEVHADVADVRPYLSRASVVIVPTRLGGGVKNKVLEACAMGRPVVASPRALGGLNARRGTDVICASGESSWLHHVERLLQQPTVAAAIGANGRRWVQQEHRWPDLAQRLGSLLTWAASSRRTSSAVPAPATTGDSEAPCR